MKPILTCAALAGWLVLTGCETPALISLEAFAAPGEAIVDPALAGVWQVKDDGDVCVVRRDANTAYSVVYYSDSGATKFSAVLFKVGEAEFLDLVPSESDDFRVPAHTLARVWPEAGRLRWAFVDSEWLRGQAVSVSSRPLKDNKILLTAPAAALRGLLATAGADSRANGEITEWQRLQ